MGYAAGKTLQGVARKRHGLRFSFQNAAFHAKHVPKNRTNTTLIQAAIAGTAAQKQDHFANLHDSLAETQALNIIFV
jgi:hypothetical protein